MIVCMPVTHNQLGLKETVFSHFGSAPFFAMFDTESRSLRIVANDNHHHGHGACQPVQWLKNDNVGAVLTAGMGRRAVEMFNQAGIDVWLHSHGTVEEAIALFEQNRLQKIDPATACGGHGHHECGHGHNHGHNH